LSEIFVLKEQVLPVQSQGSDHILGSAAGMAVEQNALGSDGNSQGRRVVVVRRTGGHVVMGFKLTNPVQPGQKFFRFDHGRTRFPSIAQTHPHR